MATKNKFAGLKLYAFFDLKTVDEAPKCLLSSVTLCFKLVARKFSGFSDA
jgi:hypothetical protein